MPARVAPLAAIMPATTRAWLPALDPVVDEQDAVGPTQAVGSHAKERCLKPKITVGLRPTGRGSR
jgi:hypothetical protein